MIITGFLRLRDYKKRKFKPVFGDYMQSQDIYDELTIFVKNYFDGVIRLPFAKSPLKDSLVNVVSLLEANLKLPTKFQFDYSIGQGQYAAIPWIAIFNKEITTSAQKGIYIVFLFSPDKKNIYLTLNQGFHYFESRYGKIVKAEI